MSIRKLLDHEEDTEAFPHETWVSTHWPGVALRVLGWEILPDFDHHDHYERTGRVVVRMVGDDKHWYIEKSTLTPIPEDNYCHDCGQIGCTSNIAG